VKNEKELFYFLIRDNSKLNKNYSISIWEFNKKFKFINSINISSIKLFRKKVEEKSINKVNIFYIYKLNPKFIMFEILNCQYFFVGRNDDNSLKIYSFNEKQKEFTNFPKKIKIESFISTLYKINENNFISGHLNGRIMEWEINNNLQLTIKRDIFAHNDTMICAINYINKHNILATSAEDGNIYIRKYYNFELLTIIKLSKNEYANEILLSNYDMYYILKFNKNNMKFNFDIYSINGINIIQKNCDLYIQNFYCIDNGKIIFTLKSNNKVFYYCLFNDIIKVYKIGNDKINNFLYYEKNNIFYIISENGDLIRFEENELTFLLNEIKRKTKTKNI
jgi:WD40 repeat protein